MARLSVLLAFAGLTAAAALAGCSGARETLGLEKKPAPDEFAVTTRQPLALPPNFQLRPPQPGAAPLETAVTEKAKQTVFGRDPKATPTGASASAAANAGDPAVPGFQRLSAGEQAILARAGASNADPNIRILVDRDSQQIADANKTLVDDLLFWRKQQEPGVIIDANAEAQRLRDNAAAGKTATEGDTPIIKRKSRGILDGLLN